MHGMAQSTVVVPFVSKAALEGMAGLGAKDGNGEAQDWCDNVLLEWMLAMELERQGYGRVRKILPVMLGVTKEVEAEGQTGAGAGAGAGTASGFTPVAMTDLFDEMQKPPPLPDFVSHATVSALRQFVEGTLGKQLSGEWEGRTVKEVVAELLKYQGVKAWDIKVTHAQVLYM